ncbi:tRNA (cytidine(34)-2'-O)-methyltransferase [Wenzhouxiangella sp. XN79A]|uniref:tRNA (cytidine(34)-2'-O)-methyltransferase n=1 Tax=Wenzhouxiangella sp. XN79A TaxID=2724193 RepID=UPI001981D884|nr:tRNA (cytidine(34)-2'-O)-methyltransferase [Wenzhouxiangella sp. XN79A]
MTDTRASRPAPAAGSPPDVVLYQPEIPPNTGNILRLCANTGARLHLVRPLGFALDDRRMRRAGLDHVARESLTVHADFATCRTSLGTDRRWLAVETGGAVRHDRVAWRADDVLVFGSETRGLPDEVLAQFPPECRVAIPQRAGSRSLNLSNAVAVVVYEAWRQQEFGGAA